LNLKIVLTFLILLFSTSYCSKPCDSLIEQVKKEIPKDSALTRESLDKITMLIKEDQKSYQRTPCGKIFLVDGNLDECALIGFLKQNNINTGSICQLSRSRVSFYIDPSGSMLGYAEGRTAFKNLFAALVTSSLSSEGDENVRICFVNDKQAAEVPPADKLNKEIFSYPFRFVPSGFQPSSEFSKLLNVILNDVKSTGDVAIFYTDNIYTPDKPQNAVQSMEIEGEFVKKVFMQKLKDFPNMITIIYQLESDFSGLYQTVGGQIKNLKSVKRPYYLWVISNPENLQSFLSYAQVEFQKKENGYRNKASFFKYESLGEQYAILYNTGRIGRFEIDREDHSKIKKWVPAGRDEGDGTLQLTLAYKTIKNPIWGIMGASFADKENFKVTPDGIEMDIKPIADGNMDSKDKPKSAGMDYMMTLKTNTSVIQKVDQISIELPPRVSEWIETDSTDSDVSVVVENTKTLSLKYLLRGILEAYYASSGSKQLLKINLKLEK